MYRTILLILFLYGISVSVRAENKITFSHPCKKGETITIAAMGDILLHRPLQVIGLKKGFESLWEVTLPIIQSVNIAYANLEGPINDSNHLGTGFPLFGYPSSLALSLKDSGFTIVSTANNHALDQYSVGIDNTIKALNNAGIAYVGTRMRGSSQSWSYIMRKNNFSIAWIACTEHTNGISDPYNQILYCYKPSDQKVILQMIQDLRYKVDAIIVTPHWGEQYENLPNNKQKQFAYRVLNAGALAVLGSHPHVLQSAEKFITRDGREAFIVYSLGNFVSFQGSIKNRLSAIILLRLTKNSEGTVINGVQIIPIYMQNRDGFDNMSLEFISNNKNSSLLGMISQVLPLGNIKNSKMIDVKCN
jgi:poly-gamma-glutamate capsule biosynthesis protein CapA/YwtB (metallophosphatase superfamily)